MSEREKQSTQLGEMWVAMKSTREAADEAKRRWPEVRAALEYARHTYDVRIGIGFTESYNLTEVPAECPTITCSRAESEARYAFAAAALAYLEQFGEPWSPPREAAGREYWK